MKNAHNKYPLKCALSAWVMAILIPALADAAEISQKIHNTPASEGPFTFSYIVQIIISFIVVIIFILLVAWALRRYGRITGSSDEAMKVISALSVGMREKIILVQIGSERIMVGIAPGQVRALHVMKGQEPVPRFDEEQKHSFQKLIKKYIK